MYTDPFGLFGTEKKAEKRQKKDIKRFGEDRVGDIYNRNEGTDKKADWGYAVYGEGKDKSTRAVDNPEGDITVTTDRRDASIFSSDDSKRYRRFQPPLDMNEYYNNLMYGQPLDRKIGIWCRKHGMDEDKINKATEPYTKGAVLLSNRAISVISSVKTFATGSDIYENEADALDYVLAGVDIVTLGMGEYLKCIKYTRLLRQVGPAASRVNA